MIQMSVVMTAPTKHPRSGIYRVRIAIPAHLREVAYRLYARRAEFQESLGTSELREAKRLAPAAVARIEVKLALVRNAAAGRSAHVSERDIQSIAGEWYRAQEAEWADDPGRPENWENSPQADQVVQTEDGYEGPVEVNLSTQDRERARVELTQRHLPATPKAVDRLAHALFWAQASFDSAMSRRANGDWRPDTTADRFPTRRPKEVANELARQCSLDDLLRGWSADRGWALDAKPINRNLYDRLRTMERLASFLAHRNASAVTKADAVRWKVEAQARDLKSATIRNDVSEMSAIWNWGMANGAALPHGNPFAGILPPKDRRRSSKRPFTDAEATMLLKTARGETGLLRWLPWVCALTGARLGEIVQSTKEDVVVSHGVTLLRIHEDGADRSLKNSDSRRVIPLHPALIAEGFVEYVRALPAGSPLFPDAVPDAIFGRRASLAGKRVGVWLRKLGISDPMVSPNHSWRHLFIDLCRRAQLHQEVRSALTGHSARADESGNYGQGMGTFVKLLASEMAKVPLPEGM